MGVASFSDGSPGESARSRMEAVVERQVFEHELLSGSWWHRGDEDVRRLTSASTGVWSIDTQGTRYVWDLDAWVFWRLPGRHTRAAPMPFDGQALRIGRVEVFPAVGARLHVWFDEPDAVGPALTEHFRVSSTIRRIARLRPCDCPPSQMPAAGHDDIEPPGAGDPEAGPATRR